MPLLLCPNDNTQMQELDRNGVLIDICPECRGVWLDRGELEKLLDLVGREHEGMRRPAAAPREAPQSEHRHDYRHRKRKKRFELFDFFD